MKNTTIFTYDKKPCCEYCVFYQGGACPHGKPPAPCAQFRYDVFKRTPRKRPPLKQFEPSEFEL